MDELRKVAFESVARGCGFAGLAIVCVVGALSFDPLLAARTGGLLMTLTTVVLLVKARQTASQDHRRTELWMMLDRANRPPKSCAQRVASGALREAYLSFAYYAAAVTIACWVVALMLSLAGWGQPTIIS